MRKIYIFIMCALLINLNACGGNTKVELVNIKEIDAKLYSEIKLDFDEDDIFILTNDSSNIIIKEYMNKNEKKFYAKYIENNNQLLITEGVRSKFINLKSYIEVYIPLNYKDILNVHTTNGIIEIKKFENELSNLSINSTNGDINIEKLNTTNLKITSTRSNITLNNSNVSNLVINTTSSFCIINEITAQIEYKNKNGDLIAKNVIGFGFFESSGNGSIDLQLNSLNGNINGFCKNGKFIMSIFKKESFNFLFKSKNGKIDFNYENIIKDGNEIRGNVGLNTDVQINIETKNGSIKIQRK